MKDQTGKWLQKATIITTCHITDQPQKLAVRKRHFTQSGGTCLKLLQYLLKGSCRTGDWICQSQNTFHRGDGENWRLHVNGNLAMTLRRVFDHPWKGQLTTSERSFWVMSGTDGKLPLKLPNDGVASMKPLECPKMMLHKEDWYVTSSSLCRLLQIKVSTNFAKVCCTVPTNSNLNLTLCGSGLLRSMCNYGLEPLP